MDSLLYDAVTIGDISKLEQLTAKDPSILLRISRPKKETVLHVAAANNCSSSVDFVCKLCPELIMKRNSKGDSALHIAARAGYRDLLRHLMDKVKEADPEAGEAIVYQSVGSDDIESRVSMELQWKATRIALLKLRNKDENTVLDEAVRNGELKMFELPVEEEPQLANYFNGSNESPLYLAAARGELKIVQKILQLGSDGRIDTINHKGRDGQTALHVATARGHTKIAIELVTQMKERLREKDNAGRTPRHYAAFFGSSILSLQFVKMDTSGVYFRDKDGHSALHVAASKGHHNIVAHLIESCSDAKDLLNRENQNVLHTAVKYGKVKAIKF